MEKKFRRAVLLCPAKYSLFNSFYDILSAIVEEVTTCDIMSAIKKRDDKINSQIFRFPNAVRGRWEIYFMTKINRILLDIIRDSDADLVLIYNSVFLLPETCAEISKKARLVFFMGDSPFYTPQNNYYLSCLTYADLILSPDTFWNQQLNTLGLNKTIYFIPGLAGKSYFRIENLQCYPEDEESEILYVGSCYLNSWGYKKALLMSKFTGFNFKLFGNKGWKRWFSFFPELETVYRETDFIAQDHLNRMFNLTKIIPVDGNPGIINGVHLRLFEALGAGAMPLTEYRVDVENMLFKNFKGILPLIKDYNQATDLASHFLSNEMERKEIVVAMHKYLMEEYSVPRNAERLLEALK